MLPLRQCLRDFSGQQQEFIRGILMKKISLYIQHCSNPLHVYCWLIKTGLSQSFSMLLCKGYERYIFRWFRFIVIFAMTSFRKKLFGRLSVQ